MKNKILKLAKRLETFRLEDIESIMGDGIEDGLQELVKDGQLNLVGGIYSYKAEVFLCRGEVETGEFSFGYRGCDDAEFL